MNEGDVRRVHGIVGVLLSLFVLVQVGSGTLIAVNEFLGLGRHVHAEPSQHHHDEAADTHQDENEKDGFLQIIHHHGERPVQALRVLLGIGIVFMVLSGTRIYFLARMRTKKMSTKAL